MHEEYKFFVNTLRSVKSAIVADTNVSVKPKHQPIYWCISNLEIDPPSSKHVEGLEN